jgi:hypothetical protein
MDSTFIETLERALIWRKEDPIPREFIIKALLQIKAHDQEPSLMEVAILARELQSQSLAIN